jgi:hypothetical protein
MWSPTPRVRSRCPFRAPRQARVNQMRSIIATIQSEYFIKIIIDFLDHTRYMFWVEHQTIAQEQCGNTLLNPYFFDVYDCLHLRTALR